MTTQMKQQRLGGLADGIFAIVMTLLTFEFRIPVIEGNVTDNLLWSQIEKMWPVFLSFILTFALLFTYWRAHHFLVSVYAKSLTVGLANLNALFFFLITLIPFTAHLLGQYSTTRIAIVIYGLNTILIGITLWWMRVHIEQSPKVEHIEISWHEHVSGYVRILFPVLGALIAILVSFFSPEFSIIFFTVAILFNLLPASMNPIYEVLNKIMGKVLE